MNGCERREVMMSGKGKGKQSFSEEAENICREFAEVRTFTRYKDVSFSIISNTHDILQCLCVFFTNNVSEFRVVFASFLSHSFYSSSALVRSLFSSSRAEQNRLVSGLETQAVSMSLYLTKRVGLLQRQQLK